MIVVDTSALMAILLDEPGNDACRDCLLDGDCFAYQLAMAQGCALLFVGTDFSQTDIVSAVP